LYRKIKNSEKNLAWRNAGIYFVNLGIDGRIMLKRILKECSIWTGLIWLRTYFSKQIS